MSRECWVVFYNIRIAGLEGWHWWADAFQKLTDAVGFIEDIRDMGDYRNISEPIHVKEAPDE